MLVGVDDVKEDVEEDVDTGVEGGVEEGNGTIAGRESVVVGTTLDVTEVDDAIYTWSDPEELYQRRPVMKHT